MGRLFLQTFAGAVYNVCIRGCERYPWRTHVFAFKVDQIGPEMGKTGTEIVSPILDKRKGRRDTPHMGHCSPQEISAEPDKGDGSTESDNTRVSTIMIDVSKHFAEPRRMLLEITCGFEEKR